MSDVKFEPLRSLARNAQRRHMEMQCDPSWVLDVFDERDALAQRCRELEGVVAQRDEAIEEWSGTAVQNGMECDTLLADNERLRGLIDQIQQIVTHPHESKEALAARVRQILEVGQ